MSSTSAASTTPCWSTSSSVAQDRSRRRERVRDRGLDGDPRPALPGRELPPLELLQPSRCRGTAHLAERPHLRPLRRPLALMVKNLVVDVLLGLGVAAQLICCLGVAVMRSAFDRLHYASAGTTVGPSLMLAAVLVREGVTSAGLEAIAAVALLFLVGPALVHGTARAARRIEHGTLEPRPPELRRGRT